MPIVKFILLIIALGAAMWLCVDIPFPLWFITVPIYWGIGYLAGREFQKIQNKATDNE